MTTQPPSLDDSGETDRRFSPAQATEQANAPMAKQATAQPARQAENQISSFERATLRWAKLAVLMSFLAALFVCLQWYEMRNGARDTHDLAVNAQKQADRMQGLVDQMRLQAGATHDLAAAAAAKQADASKALTDLTAKEFTASQQVVESQRASISVAFAYVLNPVTFREGALSFAFAVIMKNNGRLPANKVKVRYQPYFSQLGSNIFSEPMERQRDFCKKPNVSGDNRRALRGLTNEDALTIVPGGAEEWQINFGMGKPGPDYLIELPNDPTAKKRVFPIVVGCVDYQSGVMPQPHQTGFIFEVQRASGSNPGMSTMINYGEDVRREEVIVTQYFFGQGKSY